MKNAIFVIISCLASAVSVAGPAQSTVSSDRSMDAAIHPDLLNRQRDEALAMIARHAKEREAASLAAARIREEGGPQQAARLKSQQHPAR